MVFGVKMGSGLHLPLYCGYFPLYVNMFIGLYSRSQVRFYRTIGPIVYLIFFLFLHKTSARWF